MPLTVPHSESVLPYRSGHVTNCTCGNAHRGHAIFDPAQPFRIADLSTSEQAPLFATDLTAVPGGTDEPMSAATVYLEGREDGDRFAVHSRDAPHGQPSEMFARLTVKFASIRLCHAPPRTHHPV